MEQERPDAEVPPGEGRHFNALLRLLKQLKEAVQATAQEITPRIPGWQPGKERPALAGRWNSGVPSLGLACADAMRVAPPIFATMEFTPELLIQLAEMVREIGEFMAMLGPA